MTKQEEEKFRKECRSWLNPPTKWMHGVGLKGVRTDCINFIAEVSKEMGWLNKDYKIKAYPRDWALHKARHTMIYELGRYCFDVGLEDRKTGDIFLYKFGRSNCHAAFYLGDNKAIHSHIQYGVVEFNLEENEEMKKHFSKAIRWEENK